MKRTTATLLAGTLCLAAACKEPTDPDPREVPLAERVLAFSQGGDIWVMNGDGSRARNLTRSAAADDAPAWSADGRYIFFHSDVQGRAQLFRMDADGANAVQLTHSPVAAVYPWPSPDGQAVAFTTFGRDYDIAVRQADGAIRVLTGQGSNETGPAWSPLGDRIAFARNGPEGGIYTVRPDGSGLARVTSSYSEWPSWAPDGTRMVVLGDLGLGPRLHLLLADGATPPLTGPQFFAGAPDWSSDGRWILFSAEQPEPAGIWVIRPNGTGARRLPYTGQGQFPRWKPLPRRTD